MDSSDQNTGKACLLLTLLSQCEGTERVVGVGSTFVSGDASSDE